MNLIPVYKPNLKNYKESAINAIHSEWISNHGKYVDLATNKLKDILNVKNIILMNNGTCATHCLLLALKYKYPQIKKIYIPNNCYVAVYNCALMEYNINELEVLKINNMTWNMEMSKDYLLSLDKDSAIMIVHNLGGIIDVDYIKKIRKDIILIEDNCEGLFGKYNNKYTSASNAVLCSSISFYGNKIITTGEGGAFITNDDFIYNYIKHIYSQGMTSIKFIHNLKSYNYRMTNIQAAFLYDQLNDINTILKMKKKIFTTYKKLLKDDINNKKITLQKNKKNCISADWMFAIRINNNNKNINDITKYFLDNNIEIRPFFYPYYYHKHLKEIPNKNDNTISDELNKDIIILPSYPELTISQIIYIIKILKSLIYI